MSRKMYTLAIMLCIFYGITFAEEMSLEAQLEEASQRLEEEEKINQDLKSRLENIEVEIAKLKEEAKELEEKIGE